MELGVHTANTYMIFGWSLSSLANSMSKVHLTCPCLTIKTLPMQQISIWILGNANNAGQVLNTEEFIEHLKLASCIIIILQTMQMKCRLLCNFWSTCGLPLYNGKLHWSSSATRQGRRGDRIPTGIQCSDFFTVNFLQIHSNAMHLLCIKNGLYDEHPIFHFSCYN